MKVFSKFPGALSDGVDVIQKAPSAKGEESQNGIAHTDSASGNRIGEVLEMSMVRK